MRHKLFLPIFLFIAVFGFLFVRHLSTAIADAVITVNSTADDISDDGECTLREAIIAANTDTPSGVTPGDCIAGDGNDTIAFSIPGAGPHTIQPESELPFITTLIAIDGYTEPGSQENTAISPNPLNGTLMIEIDGQNAGVNASALTFEAGGDGSSVRGLVLNRFDFAGVRMDDVSSMTVAGNYIGTNVTGMVALANLANGVTMASPGAQPSNSFVGGVNPEDRNLISGNLSAAADDCAIAILPDIDNFVVQGNIIGMAADGVTELANQGAGVCLGTDSQDALVGGAVTGAGNLISGNESYGVTQGMANNTGTVVQGNFIGTDYTGVVEKGNGDIAVNIGSQACTIGGTTALARNVISGNDQTGLALSGSDCVVQGNYFGLGADGVTVLSNGNANQPSVSVEGDNNLVGGSSAAQRNVFAGGEASAHVFFSKLSGDIVENNRIQGNYIGTLADGSITDDSGALVAGVFFLGGTQNNLVGGTGVGEGNLIRGNGSGILAMNVDPFASVLDSFLGNSIYDNSGGTLSSIGIDLAYTPDFFGTIIDAGPTPNDVGDPDEETNHIMNFPIITAISTNEDSVTLTYDLDINDSEAGATGYRVEFFANNSGDPTGYGQGERFIGADTVAGDVSGRSVTFSNTGLSSGTYAFSSTTTMTDNSSNGFGHTSEFGPVVPATLVVTPGGGGSGGGAGSNGLLADSGVNAILYLMLALALITVGGAAWYAYNQKQT